MTDLTQDAPILGSPAFIPDENRFLHNQRLGKIVDLAAGEIDPRYLYYLLSSPIVRAQIRASATGTTVRHTAPERIYEVRAVIPDLDRQTRIAGVLSAYDDLIENSRRRIQLLEEFAQLIFAEWFGKFRFPGHESARLVESKIGPTPEGWDVVTAAQVLEVDPRIKVAAGEEHPFVPLNGLSNNSMVIETNGTRSQTSGSKFQNGDTLFARITPSLENGKTGYVQSLPGPDAVGLGSTEFMVLRSRGLCPEYVYLLARTDAFRAHAIKSMTGASGRQRVQERCLDSFWLAKPTEDVLSEFHRLTEPVFAEVEALHQRIRVLSTTRDFLLPRLIHGDMDVPDGRVDSARPN